MTIIAAARPSADSPRAQAWRRFVRNRAAVAGLVVLALFGAAVAAGPELLPLSPFQVDPANAFAASTGAHPLGTDESGRDVLARLLYGGRVSLLVGMVSVGLAIVIGTLLGGLSGYFGGWVDAVLMRLTDGFMAVPTFFLILVTLSLFGGSLGSVVLVIGLTSWMTVARLVRGEFLRWKTQDFVAAARALGAPDALIMVRHLLPHALPSLTVAAAQGVAFAILTESAVSYLGLGIQPPMPSWGNMLSNAQNYVWTRPVLAVYPGLAILVTVLAFHFVSNGLRDAVDPERKP